jgi:RNA polymerase sigma factor (sigma-70 family)
MCQRALSTARAQKLNMCDRAPPSDDHDDPETLAVLRRALAGDQQALTDLYEAHAGRVRRSLTARATQRDPQQLEDAVQETFIYAFERITKGEFELPSSAGAFRNWLAKIAVNKMLDGIRSRRTERRGGGREQVMRDAFSASAHCFELPSPLARPSAAMHRGEFEQKIEQSLASLDEEHRRVIDLRDHCGMEFEEIAEEMGYKNAGSVRSFYRRAKDRLKDLLGRAGIEAL